MTARPSNVIGSVLALSAVLASAAGALAYFTLRPLGPAVEGHAVPWLVLAALFAASEMCVLHVHVRGQAYTFSLSEIPFALGLVFVSPLLVLAARLVGSGGALVLYRRQPRLKVVFNLSYFAFDCGLIVLVHRLVLGGADPLGPQGWAAVVVALTVGLGTGLVVIAAVIAVVEQRQHTWVLDTATGFGLLNTWGGANAGLLAATVIVASPEAWWLLAGLSVLLGVAYRSHGQLRHSHQHLEQVYGFTKRVNGFLTGDAPPVELLREIAEILRAERAELVLAPLAGDATVTALTLEGNVVDVTAGPVAEAVLARRLAALGDRSSCVLALAAGATRAAGDEDGDLRDAAVSRLGDPEAPIGTLMVANRLGDLDSIGPADSQLLEALATHTAVALVNRALVGRLRDEADQRAYDARHDPLTGLPNRVELESVLSEALTVRQLPIAVLLVDLNGFKDVNDTLGHHQGDQLLADVALRLAGAAVGSRLVARLGGDEFAVVWAGDTTQLHLEAVGQAIAGALDRPFRLGELDVDISASIGIARAPEHGTDGPTLLQRADVAMYAAKHDRSTCALYDPARDHHSPERLALAADLRRAVERREVLVVYQPKVDLRSGAVVGAEALMRWHHPTRGMVGPDEFIPTAERAGLMRPLTEFVLGTALSQARQWAAQRWDIPVAVNLSPTSLLDESLSTTIAALVADGDLGQRLTLEITETTIIADPARVVAGLNRLSAMGIRLAIDDFGTGYSSLAYLKTLPVDELKIDQSFVRAMIREPADAAIVRSTIELGHNLGLQVTAEGVEDIACWRDLVAAGCDTAQGYLIGRPLTPVQFTGWLKDHRALNDILAGG